MRLSDIGDALLRPIDALRVLEVAVRGLNIGDADRLALGNAVTNALTDLEELQERVDAAEPDTAG
jgi:hypothetical protein